MRSDSWNFEDVFEVALEWDDECGLWFDDGKELPEPVSRIFDSLSTLGTKEGKLSIAYHCEGYEEPGGDWQPAGGEQCVEAECCTWEYGVTRFMVPKDLSRNLIAHFQKQIEEHALKALKA